MPRRLAWALELQSGQGPHGSYRSRWEAAEPELRLDHPGLDLSPRADLIPLGKDPASGLWEFWHPSSGSEPRRDAQGGLLVTEETGLVLVLVDDRWGWIGASPRAGHPNFDADADTNEVPAVVVECGAFLISKYEMTQGQWTRVTGENPSRFPPGGALEGVDAAHPVDSVSWEQAHRVTRWMGMSLPTEAQWELACRAGTRGPFWFAPEPPAAFMNVQDVAHSVVFSGVSLPGESWDDGHAGPAPVDSFPPNPLGLHQVHGNVMEWCLDDYAADYHEVCRFRDPLAEPGTERLRVARGGAIDTTAFMARASFRYYTTAERRVATVGLRPVLHLR